MFKQSNDAFLVNELIGNNLTDLIIEGDVYIPENSYSMEEIPLQGVTEKMVAKVTPTIDYIDSKIVSERKAVIKAVVNINTEVINSRNVSYITSIESDGTFQAKTNSVFYTDVFSKQESELPISETITLEPNINEILNILKIDVNPKISESDIMNERMLIEGTCHVGVLYTENNSFATLNYITKEFPFTHYVELKNSDDSMRKNISINVANVEYNLTKDDNDENKILKFDIDMIITTELYNTINKDIICDAYSTTNEVEIESSNI